MIRPITIFCGMTENDKPFGLRAKTLLYHNICEKHNRCFEECKLKCCLKKGRLSSERMNTDTIMLDWDERGMMTVPMAFRNSDFIQLSLWKIPRQTETFVAGFNVTYLDYDDVALAKGICEENREQLEHVLYQFHAELGIVAPTRFGFVELGEKRQQQQPQTSVDEE